MNNQGDHRPPWAPANGHAQGYIDHSYDDPYYGYEDPRYDRRAVGMYGDAGPNNNHRGWDRNHDYDDHGYDPSYGHGYDRDFSERSAMSYGHDHYDNAGGLRHMADYPPRDDRMRNTVVVDPLARPEKFDTPPPTHHQQSLDRKPPPPSFERSMPKEKRDILCGRSTDQTIEVAPGVNLRLRGAAETWSAVERDQYVPCECFACATTVFCIQDAEYVICPLCRVVSPLQGGVDGGGVGLGFTMEDLARWQEDIVRNMERQRSSRGLRY